MFKTSAAKQQLHQHQHRAEDLTFVRQLAIFEAMLVILAPPRVELQESGGSSHNVNILEMLRLNISHSHSDSGVMTGHILWIPSAGCTDEYTWYHRGLCPSFFLIWQRQLACLCPVVIYNQSPIHPWMCPPAAAASPSLVPPCGVNVNVEQASGPSSHYRRSLLKDVCEAPLNVCCDNVSRVCVFPPSLHQPRRSSV